ncbi:glycosyltransferase [Bacillus sp. AFS040349]|uniref:polysaccharide deacetylase family protein n=1 Tax=Bacillus sp. AFS040349 TaxID=2033502 RepID=UPI000BFD8E0A|nr:glycosyltransferase [Bacillus sp. AFS040349]PGT88779.1 glycosyl transferase family 2 [Bacillus sp. AFS040349]
MFFNKGKSKSRKKFIFQDTTGKRWRKIWLALLILLMFFSSILSIIGFSLFNNPALPQVHLEKSSSIQPVNEPFKETKKEFQLPDRNQQQPYKILKEEIYGFYLVGDKVSEQSFKNNIDSLGVLVPNWYWLDSDKTLSVEDEEEIIDLAREHKVKIMPTFSLAKDTDEAVLNELLNTENTRTVLINSLFQKIRENQFTGINIDLKEISVDNTNSFTMFMTELYQKFHTSDLQVMITVSPENDAYDYSKLAATADRIIVKFFKQLHELKQPEPVAPIDWFQQKLEQLPIPSEKLIVSLSNEGYEWDMERKALVNCLMFHEVMEAANSSNLKAQWDSNSMNPYIRFTKNNVPHTIWFLDAATSYNQIKVALTHDVKGIAIDQLGYEDPGLWKYVSNTFTMESTSVNLENIENPIPVMTKGNGEIIRLSGISQEGKRKITLDSDGFISNEVYHKYPLLHYIEKYGGSPDKKIVLSFDDGPDPAFTPKILDILSKEQVRASFFIVGQKAALYPDILQRIHREGHEIGNHTFSHSDITEDSPKMLQAELNSTQRLIQQITGHSTTLYRPPYTIDLESDSTEELVPYLQSQEMGYTMVGAYIDPKDWNVTSSKDILNNTLDHLSDGHIVLLHDSGGDRSATVEALPEIIKALKDKGYTFVTSADLINKSRLEMMPKVEEEPFPYVFFYKIANTIYIWIVHICTVIFMLGIILGILRLLILFLFSLKHSKNHSLSKTSPGYQPYVSIVIPAYNEETVIEKTLQSILRSHYPYFEIIVVNDGSKDKTSEIVWKIARKSSRPLHQMLKPNEGKTAAINHGVLKARGEIIVMLDADTSITPDTISLLVNHFSEKKVAGVSGNVRIGNIRNLITLWQHVEYVTGFNLEKRAFHELNCITVVPGAIGAFRKSAIIKAGFFAGDTLAEDTDITLKLLRMGYRIHYEPEALGYTEAPETIRSFIKQRFRWCYGIFQCLWKHSGALFNPKQKGLGFIGLPYMWSQYAFQSLTPLIDIVFLIGLFGDTPRIVTYYILFFLVDLLVTFYAFRLEKLSTKPLLLLVLQRIVYRHLLTYAVWKALAFAAKGVLIGWNKLKRSGNVLLP